MDKMILKDQLTSSYELKHFIQWCLKLDNKNVGKWWMYGEPASQSQQPAWCGTRYLNVLKQQHRQTVWQPCVELVESSVLCHGLANVQKWLLLPALAANWNNSQLKMTVANIFSRCGRFHVLQHYPLFLATRFKHIIAGTEPAGLSQTEYRSHK